MPRFHTRTNALTGQSETVQFSAEEEAAADAEILANRFVDLNRIQFEFMVEKLGIGPAIEQAIDDMDDGDEKILARVLFRSGQLFKRGHYLFTTLAPGAGMTSEQIDEAWLQAMAV